MQNEELKNKIRSLISDATFDENQWLNVNINSDQWLALATALKENAELNFDYLFCLTGVDWKTHLTMVYHMSSTKLQHTLVIKAKIADRDNPVIETVSHLWRTAEMHEREAYDLFGIRFAHHPDLRRLFLTDDWKGWPLRKDYEDEINMIKL
jgi:NADH-quinone oxidoreductase subunit C